MTVLRSYVGGAWTEPADDGRPVLDAVPHAVLQRIEIGAAQFGSGIDVAREEMPVQHTVRITVEHHFGRGHGAGFDSALAQERSQRQQLRDLRISVAMEELDSQRRLSLAGGLEERVEQPV